jgi:anti-anti-sigma factor
MNAMAKTIEVARCGNVTVVTPQRDLREFDFQQIQYELGRFAEDPAPKRLVFDLGHTDALGSTALGLLVRLSHSAQKLALCNLSEHEREILRVTGLAEALPVFSSLSEAVRSVA